MKPIARWTIGPVSNCGMKILEESLSAFKKVYPDIDRIVCYNQIKAPNINDTLYKQKEKEIDYPLTPAEKNHPTELGYVLGGMAGSGWKLCPPRLRKSTHELWIDNDIVIHQKMKEIDDWLEGDYCLISEGLGRNYGKIYEKEVPIGIKACAGFFGLPPNFDFNQKILEYCKLLKGKSLGSYDEQGLVASIITNSNHVIVPLTSIAIIEPTFPLPEPLTPALHFVGANRVNHHESWNAYQRKNIRAL